MKTGVPLELVVLGSGGPGATGRAASGHLVLIDGTARVLVDAGPGSFARLGESNLSLSETG
jgi:ribonuclease BN (tRNA processing enzyme)